jgi:predicted Zn-dependent peptidase
MKFNKKTLENGLRIITVPMVDNPSVTVLVMVEAGSKYENKTTNGLSHFLEHMVFKGTPRRPKAIDISKELDSIGSHYNAFTTQEFTGYYAKVDKRHLDTVIDVVSDMYNNPLFDEEEIKKEKGVIAEEIKMYQDLPQQHVQDVFMELLYGDTPTGWNVAGTVENVKSFTREDFIKYRSQHYLASSTIVVVSGSIDENETIGKIEKAFGNISTDSKSKKAHRESNHGLESPKNIPHQFQMELDQPTVKAKQRVQFEALR